MSNSEIPDQSESTSSKLRVLQDVLIGQNEDVTLLCSVIEYIKCNKETGLDEQDITKYSNQISNLKLRQRARYEAIDTKINENIRDIKREKTRDSNVLEYGKEVRKLESGLRTLILFTGDVVNMLRKNSTVINRVDDRIYYFDKRSAILEQEIYSLQQKMAIN